jgi:hypothetical protein
MLFALGVATCGALAAVGGSLIGARILNVRAILMVVWARPDDHGRS